MAEWLPDAEDREQRMAAVEDVLLRMVDVQRKVEKLTNEELALVLVELTGNLHIESYHYQVLMEAAYRLDPESFEKA